MSKMKTTQFLWHDFALTGADVGKHDSDLYVEKTPETERMVEALVENKVVNKPGTFISDSSNKRMYEFPFIFVRTPEFALLDAYRSQTLNIESNPYTAEGLDTPNLIALRDSTRDGVLEDESERSYHICAYFLAAAAIDSGDSSMPETLLNKAVGYNMKPFFTNEQKEALLQTVNAVLENSHKMTP